jgi:hypothetical protein
MLTCRYPDNLVTTKTKGKSVQAKCSIEDQPLTISASKTTVRKEGNWMSLGVYLNP